MPHSQLSQLFSEIASLNKELKIRKLKKTNGANEIENDREASEKKGVKGAVFTGHHTALGNSPFVRYPHTGTCSGCPA